MVAIFTLILVALGYFAWNCSTRKGGKKSKHSEYQPLLSSEQTQRKVTRDVILICVCILRAKRNAK